MQNIHVGNAELDGRNTRGWIVGNFIPEGCIRHSDDVEVKWAVHKAGTGRDDWVEGEHRTTVCILVSGKAAVEFLDREPVILEKAGDYVMWGVGVSHKRKALEDCVTVTIRWPSSEAK